MDERAEVYTRTRLALQSVAEHVLSAALHEAKGKIGLRQAPGGFGTPPFPSAHGDRRLRVDGVELVREDDRGEVRAPLTTLRAAAELAEVAAGAPVDVYTPSTTLDPDAALEVDEQAAAQLAEWYALTNEALEQLRDECADEDPAIVQLWPEHFDLATTITEVNYGGSPGDEGHPTPYLYVGPWSPPEPDGDYWNEPFGASVTSSGIKSDGDALAFFRMGRTRLSG